MQIASDSVVPSEASLRGLSEAEVRDRRARGLGNNVRLETSRSYTRILRDNLLTFINLVLFGIGLVLVLLGLYTDALLSVGIALMNVVIGVIQEMRAKRALDRIALLTRPKATVIRDGAQQVIDPSEIVVGDLLVVRAGDQIVVDGRVVGDSRADVDELLLTGESDRIPKRTSDPVYSGSFVVTGSAIYEAEKVGTESLANRLTTSARAFRQVKTPLQQDVNFIVRLLLLLSTQLGVLFAIAAFIAQLPLAESVKIAAVVTGLIPNGLFFMISIAYAMGAVRMAGRGALIQQSNAVESMSNINILCLDKTGTLTANHIYLGETHPYSLADDELRRILGIYAASTKAGNRTSEALHEALQGESRSFVEEVPFSSDRKWSALSFDRDDLRGVYVLGAPEMLRSHLRPDSELGALPDDWTDRGLRVVLFAYRPEVSPLNDSLERPQLPPDLIPLGVISFGDELRAEAEHTLKGFAEAGIRLKIISGDNPHTVAALARQAGLSAEIAVVSGPELDEMTPAQFAEAAETATVFGRITPHQKEKLVETLRDRGYYVAMIGDGVNDVLSLKKAQIGIAMQSGSQATRGVADIVLLNDSFAALPSAFAEGQRIVNGMQDIMRLFLSRVVYQSLIIVGVAIIGLSFPITPVHMSLLSLFTVGIPTLFLAGWSRPGAPPPRLLQSVLRFVLPAGLTLTVVGMLAYILYNIWLPASDPQASLLLARTMLTTVTTIGGLLLVLFAEPPSRFWMIDGDPIGDRRPAMLTVILLAVYLLIMFVPALRDFFELAPLDLRDWLITVALVVVWALGLRVVFRARLFDRFLRLS